MLKITDLTNSKELDSKSMACVHGGNSELAAFSAFLDMSSALTSQVADINQSFGFNFAQSNVGTVTNNQIIQGGNGVVYAPVTQTQTQGNTMNISDIGNSLLGGVMRAM